MSRPASLVVALVVLLAGCNGAVTAPSNTDAGPTYPAGLSAAGVQDPYALADAHRVALENASFTREQQLKIVADNGTVLVDETRTGAWERNRSVFQFRDRIETAPWGVRDAPNGTISYYGDGATVTMHQTYPDGAVARNVVRNVNGEPTAPTAFWVTENAAYHQTLAARYQAVMPGTVAATDDGVTVESETIQQSAIRFGAAQTPVQNVSNVAFTARIGSSGVLQSYELRVTGDWRGTRVTVRETVTFSDVGSTTVTAPAWYAADDG